MRTVLIILVLLLLIGCTELNNQPEVFEQNLNKKTTNNILTKYERKFKKACKDSNILGYLENAKFRRDIRTSEQYLYDLYDGWLLEDCVFLKLQNIFGKSNVSMVGKDSDRKVQKSKVSADPDFKININNEEKFIQLKTAARRFNEFNIKKESWARPNLILFYIIDEGNFFLVDPNNKKHIRNVDLKPNPKWGGKPCFTFYKSKVENDIGIGNIDKILKDIIK